MSAGKSYTCGLCNFSFNDEGDNCHSSCPMATGCGMIKCPNCNYEFVEESAVVNMFRRWFGKKPQPEAPNQS